MSEVSLWVCLEEVWSAVYPLIHPALTPPGQFKQARGHIRECADNQECENKRTGHVILI